MKKYLISLLFVIVLSFGATAQTKFLPLVSTYSDTGLYVAASGVDSVLFKIDNPILDSTVVFFEQYASTGSSVMSLYLRSTVNDISANGSTTLKQNAAKAKWKAVSTVVTEVSTEETMLYYGVAVSDLMAAPGQWYMLRITSSSSTNATSRIRSLGVATFRRSL